MLRGQNLNFLELFFGGSMNAIVGVNCQIPSSESDRFQIIKKKQEEPVHVYYSNGDIFLSSKLKIFTPKLTSRIRRSISSS